MAWYVAFYLLIEACALIDAVAIVKEILPKLIEVRKSHRFVLQQKNKPKVGKHLLDLMRVVARYMWSYSILIFTLFIFVEFCPTFLFSGMEIWLHAPRALNGLRDAL